MSTNYKEERDNIQYKKENKELPKNILINNKNIEIEGNAEKIIENDIFSSLSKEEEKINENEEEEINKFLNDNILIDIFQLYYTGMSSDKDRIILRTTIYNIRKYIKYYCTKLSGNFSKYILVILYQQIDEFLEFIRTNLLNNINCISDVLEIKGYLDKIGDKVNQIFKEVFIKTSKFDISLIIIELFLKMVCEENKDKMDSKELEQIKEIELLGKKEEERFVKCIEEWNSYFDRIQKGEINEDVSDAIKIDDNELEPEKESIDQDELDFANELISEELIDENILKENNIQEEDNLKDNDNISINNINETKKKRKKGKKKKIEKDIEINNEKYSNLEDLVNYINGSEIKKVKKKRKRKKKYKEIKEEIEEEEKDPIFEDFKSNLIDFTNNLEITKKIKPVLSDAFFEKLKLILG